MTTKTEKPADTDQQGLDALVQRYDQQAKAVAYQLFSDQRRYDQLTKEMCDVDDRIRKHKETIASLEGMVTAIMEAKRPAGKGA